MTQDSAKLKKNNRHGVWLRPALKTVLTSAGVAVLVALCVRLHNAPPSFDEGHRMTALAQRSAKSVALVAVEYWYVCNGERYGQTVTFGTGFLVDHAGRLLTAKHVVCPWLSDERMAEEIASLEAAGKSIGFGHRMWVWFDGQRALRPARTAELEDSTLDDLFYGETAYRSDGAVARAEVQGVGAGRPVREDEIDYGVDGDVAVVRVYPPPKGVEPLALASGHAEAPLRLAPVVALGYPLGVLAMPDCAIAASATAGHVRRCFKSVIQADVSLHTGNSGGPVLDAHGRVIGIAAQVFRDPDAWLISLPQPDMGQILPIAGSRRLLADVASGKLLWDGMIDPALPGELAALYAQARRGDLSGACRRESAMSCRLPARLLAGAVLHGEFGDMKTALARLDAVQSMEPENGEAALVRLLLTRGRGKAACNGQGMPALLACDWRSENEFYGYLARIVAGRTPLRETQDAWDCPGDRALLNVVVGVLFADRRDYETAEALLEKAVLSLDGEDWPQALAQAELDRIHTLRLDLLRSAAERKQYQGHLAQYERLVTAHACVPFVKNAHADRFECLMEDREFATALKEMSRGEPQDILHPARLAFAFAKEGKWLEAAETSGLAALPRSRESANRLGFGLLHVQMLRMAGRNMEALSEARKFLAAVKDPWYRGLAQLAIGERSERELANQGTLEPSRRVTLYTALGLKSEAEGHAATACAYYRSALDSGLDDWCEYNLAVARISKLRQGKCFECRD